MKSILTLLSVVCVASFGVTGCCSTKQCPTTKTCPMTKKACTSPSSCCATSTGTCPVKKSQQQ